MPADTAGPAVDPWLVIATAPGLTAPVLDALLARFGDAAALTRAGESALKAAGLPAATAAALAGPPPAQAGRGGMWLTGGSDRHLVHWRDPRYPALLREIPDPPVALYVQGDPACLAGPQLAIVGSRNATAAGAETAFAFARYLGGCGLTITSGLALGIDAAAHRGAIAAGAFTIAVLGTGPDEVYPRQHAELAQSIAAHGALVTEFPPGTPPRRQNFPQRNRIISGLATGTLVVEGGLQSGALVTAGFARDQGREVFAIPGSIHNPLAKGCHRLIRQGAKLVEAAGDILEELPELLAAGDAAAAGTQRFTAPAQAAAADDPDYLQLLEAFSWESVDVDTLARRSGLTAGEVSSMLLILELQGRVRPAAGGRFQRLPDNGR